MHYKTIMLALLQQSPMYEALKANKQLLPTLERTATDLKTRHAYWIEQLSPERPDSAPEQIRSEALEIAVQDIREALPDASPGNAALPEAFSLDAAMASLHRHMPPA